VEANRLRFSRLVQTEGQSAQSFCNSLQVAAENCNFGPAYSMTLKSRLLAGISSDSIRERLLAQSTALDYSGTKALFLQMDAARAQSQVLARAANVNAVRQPAQHQRQVSGQPRSSRSKQQPSRSANATRAAKSRSTSVPVSGVAVRIIRILVLLAYGSALIASGWGMPLKSVDRQRKCCTPTVVTLKVMKG